MTARYRHALDVAAGGVALVVAAGCALAAVGLVHQLA